MRPLLVAAILVSCNQRPPVAKSNGTIQVGSTFATTGNCGLISYVRPVYPKQAKLARIQGVVRVKLSLTKAGEVRDVQVISGDPALVPAAIAAVTQWRYAPCRVNGSEPLEMKLEEDVQFSLSS